MKRPPEYDNLIRTHAFVEHPSTPGALEAYLKNAQNYLDAANQLTGPNSSMPKFSSAYEGFFQLVQAVFEFYEVRTKDAGRNLAIQRVCHDLGLSPTEQKLVVKAHGRRNNTSYLSPFPPVSAAEAQGLMVVLTKCIPACRSLVGLPSP